MNFIVKIFASKAIIALAAGLIVSAFSCVPAFAQVLDQASASAPVEATLNIGERRLIQEGLIILGYYNGFADGSFGQSDRNAFANYQRDHNRSATGELSAQDALELGGAALNIRKQLQWHKLDKSLTGITISYPTALLTQRRENTLGGEELQTGDGAISLKTVRFAGSENDRLDKLYQSLLNEKGSTITYQLKRKSWFITSGTNSNRKFYTRFEQRGTEVRGYDLSWNIDENSKLLDNISVLISSSFYPFSADPADGDPSYPTLGKLADLANGNQEPAPSASGASGLTTEEAPSQQRNSTTDTQSAQVSDKDGLTEQKEGALPPPTDGSLVTSDGKGLRFVYHYFPPKDPKFNYAYQWAIDTHLFLDIPEIDGLDGIFVMPRPLQYVTRQCDTVNAFYDKKNGAVFLCYEMIDSLVQMGEALSKGASDPKALTVEFVRDNLRFILLHESGHALIDLLDIPAVGREEDSVDQLAAVLLLMHADGGETKNDIARVLQLASVWFKVNSQSGSPDTTAFADEHSLDAQRYFNLLCMVYGSDPENNSAIVENGTLPKARAARCPDEASKISRSWARLIVPHFSPRFRPKDDNSGDNQQTAAPSQPAAGGNPLEWDGKSNPFAK